MAKVNELESAHSAPAEGPAGCGPILPLAGKDAKRLSQQIFEYVRAHGRAPRAEVARALGISAGTVTSLTADLIGAGFLREVDTVTRDVGRGRPPVALEVAEAVTTMISSAGLASDESPGLALGHNEGVV